MARDPTGADTGSHAAPARCPAGEAGALAVAQGGLDRPITLPSIGTTAYVVALTGEIWAVDGVSGPLGAGPD